jgi:lysozyme family protein
MTVDTLIDGLILREGGYVDHPGDHGGPTRFGITAVTLGVHRSLGRAATREEVRALDLHEARAIYRGQYVSRYEELPDPLRVLLVDYAVMSGHVAATTALQSGLKAQGVYAGPLDGIIGAGTRTALEAVTDQRRLFLDVLDHRRRHYLRLAKDALVRQFLADHPTSQLQFSDGWQNRVWEFVAMTPEAA